MRRKAINSNKPYTIADERVATLQDWYACYGYLIKKDVRWLKGLPCAAHLFERKGITSLSQVRGNKAA